VTNFPYRISRSALFSGALSFRSEHIVRIDHTSRLDEHLILPSRDRYIVPFLRCG
jgi:hypothetical protein